MSEIVVGNLPANIYDEHRKIALLHDMFVRGIDPFFVEIDEIKIKSDEHKDFENETFEFRKDVPEPRISLNVEELFHLTQMIQEDIWNVTRFRLTGKIRVDRINEEVNERFMEYGIDNYANQLDVFIKSLIIDDGWNPESFRGYQHLLTMIRETTGRIKMNHLQALMNKARKMIPPNIAIKHIEIIEPALTKSANPKDA